MAIAIIVERLVFAIYGYYRGKRENMAVGYFVLFLLLGPVLASFILWVTAPKLKEGESLEEEDLEIIDPEEYARRQAAKEEPESDK